MVVLLALARRGNVNVTALAPIAANAVDFRKYRRESSYPFCFLLNIFSKIYSLADIQSSTGQ